MSSTCIRARGLLGVVLLLLQLAGCAAPLPQTAKIPRTERREAVAAFAKFAERACPLRLDADITVEMRLLGKTEKSAGTLQYLAPSSFRYAVVDPLGRSHFIMVSDGYQFTMVYNREAKAATGSTASHFWQEYVPPGINGDELLLLLAGLVHPDLMPHDVRGEKEGEGLWFYAVGVEGLRHEILMDGDISRVQRHIIRDGRGTVLFDVAYDRYEEKPPAECPLPLVLRMEGKTITGNITISIDRVYAGQPLSEQTFNITIPPHFQLQQVE